MSIMLVTKENLYQKQMTNLKNKAETKGASRGKFGETADKLTFGVLAPSALFEKYPLVMGLATGVLVHLLLWAGHLFLPQSFHLIPQSLGGILPALIVTVLSSVVYIVMGVTFRTSREIANGQILEGLNKNNQIQQVSILGFARISEVRDHSTGNHVQRMGLHSRVLAETLGNDQRFGKYISKNYVEDIAIAAPLHDIGKVGIADDILKKADGLSFSEFEMMKMHTIIGGDLMSELERKLPYETFYTLGKEIAYHHHQKWDGTGYPNVLPVGDKKVFFVQDGVGEPLEGEEIPLSARIVAVADVYDALVSKRVYKEAYPHEKAKEIILSDRGTHFDPDVVDAFLAAESRILQNVAAFKD